MARQGVSKAGNDVSTKQWRQTSRLFAKTAFSTFNAMSRRGANERATQAVHVARQGVNEAGNDVSTKQWRWK
ncbi:MAG: hypothetical protein CVU35_02480 [Betaproteobacteria bacterium HGW-Betaproteobacteria-8]|nr:MAG: hypothetical protein CVU35_02480 [Betaproteobacteria bacterium HGW-Betaproteobacteria-8]